MQISFLDLKKINDSFQPQLSEGMLKVIDSGYYIMGPAVEAFETSFAQYCGTKHGISVANGLDALIIILEGYKILGKLKIGDEVIVPANTYIASVIAIEKAGLVPVLCEPDLATYNINAQNIAAHLTPKTKAIMAVHLYGQLADVESLKNLCDQHQLLLIEDAAQSHGAKWNNARAGNFGNAAGFSFYPGKNLGALGDGGAITTNDDDLADVIKAYRNYGSHQKYHNLYAGINSRLDPLQAVALDLKLKRLDEDNARRRTIAIRYNDSIRNAKLVLPTIPQQQEAHVWHLYVVRVADRANFQSYLNAKGVGNLIHYPIPVHHQQAFQEMKHFSYPITEQIHKEVLSLPISPVMTDEEVMYVIEMVNEY